MLVQSWLRNKFFQELQVSNRSGSNLPQKLIFLKKSQAAWCKSGTRTRRPRTSGPGTRNPPQSLNVGPGTPLKFKSRTPGPPSKFKSEILGPPSKFKSGTPSPFFNKFIFFRIFHRLLSLCLF